MKTTIILAIIGFMLFFVAILTSSETYCIGFHHCKTNYSVGPIPALSGLISMALLTTALVRVFNIMSPIYPNSYNAESLLQFLPYDSEPPLPFSTPMYAPLDLG